MKKTDIDTQQTNRTSIARKWDHRMRFGMHLVKVLIDCIEQPETDNDLRPVSVSAIPEVCVVLLSQQQQAVNSYHIMARGIFRTFRVIHLCKPHTYRWSRQCYFGIQSICFNKCIWWKIPGKEIPCNKYIEHVTDKFQWRFEGNKHVNKKSKTEDACADSM
jgi:hypothetical protein